MSKKYQIRLDGINIEDIEKKYKLDIGVNKKNYTSLDNINNFNSEIISFVDETKQTNKCVLSIPIPRNSSSSSSSQCFACFACFACFWCRHPVSDPNIRPIGCPISYHADTVTKTYLSQISHEMFSIKENVHATKFEKLRSSDIEENDKRISFESKGYYEMFGFFCSFNCCLSFIIDNAHNTKFKYSKMLLNKIYADYTGNINSVIEPAPSWMCLIPYGGDLTIEKFRDSFNSVEYSNKGSYVLDKSLYMGTLFAKKVKF